MKRLYNLAGIALMTVMLGCAQLGLAVPQTFNDRVASAIKTSTFVLKSSALLYQSGKISKKDSQNVIEQSDLAMAGVTLAREIGTSDQAAGESKVAASLAILKALDDYVVSKGAQK